jgi:hypothetical protein
MTINILGSNREPLFQMAEQELDGMLQAHVLVTDPRRTRPRWFDGRFLAARDLANEQNYFLVRQADLGRAGGAGVIEGLMVTEVADAKTQAMRLRIDAGYGFTDTGEMVVLPEKLEIDPANIPQMQLLDAAFGLQQIPNEPGRSRTGLYVVALRPVEWTANQISAYPTSLTGERTVQDGDIIEGVVVSLVPYADNGSDEWERRRSRVAREIFLRGRDRGLASGALPLGMVALRANQIVWLDQYLARRDAGAERPAGMDFGFGQRALREAQLLQYDNHLVDVLNTLNGRGFEATACFDALPPVGRVPAQAVEADTLTHRYFPPSLTVEFAFVPEDELPALIEESLLLPPLDLEAPAETLDGLGVLILAPVKRDAFAKYYDSLGGRTIKLAAPVREMKGNTRALEFSINYQRETGLADAPADESVVQASQDWKDLIKKAQEQKLFWYVRRRHLPSAANIAGAAVDATHPEIANPFKFYRLLEENPLAKENWDTLQKNATPETKLLLKRFTETSLLEQPQMIKSILAEATAKENATAEDIIKALAPAANPKLGKGLTLIAGSDAALAKSLARDAVANTGTLTEVDRLIRETSKDKREELVAAIKEAVKKPATFAESVIELQTKYKVNPS